MREDIKFELAFRLVDTVATTYEEVEYVVKDFLFREGTLIFQYDGYTFCIPKDRIVYYKWKEVKEGA